MTSTLSPIHSIIHYGSVVRLFFWSEGRSILHLVDLPGAECVNGQSLGRSLFRFIV